MRETRIDNRIERSNSVRSNKYNKLPPRHQDSLDDVPDLSNNNQDVSNGQIYFIKEHISQRYLDGAEMSLT